MKKKLDIGNITNELAGASLFFAKRETPPPASDPVTEAKTEPTPQPVQTDDLYIVDTELGKVPVVTPESDKKKIEKVISRKIKAVNQMTDDTETPRNHDTTVSRYRDTKTPQIHGVVVEVVRKAVKEFGKEAATHRFTEAEKKRIADIIYTYKNQGIKTSENEITRIAVNFVMEDYRENGQNSVLHKILQVLNE